MDTDFKIRKAKYNVGDIVEHKLGLKMVIIKVFTDGYIDMEPTGKTITVKPFLWYKKPFQEEEKRAVYRMYFTGKYHVRMLDNTGAGLCWQEILEEEIKNADNKQQTLDL